MSVKDGVVSSPGIDLEEVANLVNSTINLDKVCTSSSINWRSKRKPVQYPSLETPSDDILRFDLNYGLTINPVGSVQQLASNKSLLLWNYNKPNGDPYTYRLTDFDGYNHYAADFLPILRDKTVYFDDDTGEIFLTVTDGPLVNLDDETTSTSTNLTAKDIVVGSGAIPLSEMYVGVMMCREGASNYYYVTADSPGLFNGISINFGKNFFSSGDKFRAWLFASNVRIIYGQSIPTGVFVGLNDNIGALLTMQTREEESSYDITVVDARQTSFDLQNITFRVRFTSYVGSHETFSNIRIYLKNNISEGATSGVIAYQDWDNVTTGERGVPTEVIGFFNTPSAANQSVLAVVASAQIGGRTVWARPAYVIKAAPQIPGGII